MRMMRACLALMAPLALAGCFLAPGIFTSSLDLRRGGDFAFAYKGEIVFQSPDDFGKDGDKPAMWKDSDASCSNPSPETGAEDGIVEPGQASMSSENSRPCTRAEIAEQRKEWQDQQTEAATRKRKEANDFATMFGFNPVDDESNRKFAALLARHDGWKSVTYRGSGIFDVDYQLSGRIGHDFVFPLFPQGDFIIPFVAIRGRDQGAVLVNAPAFLGGGMRALAARAKAMGASGGKDVPGMGRTKGVFTVTTDGEILTNNTENGPVAAPGGRRLTWEIGPASERVPEALIRVR